MPGLIDMHVHPALTNLVAPAGYLSLLFSRNAKIMLHAGFTSIRCLGVPEYVDLDAKKAAREGLVTLPRVFTAGMGLCPIGGHLKRLNIGIEVNGSREYQAAAGSLLQRGADWLKMSADAMTSPSTAKAEEMKAAADVFHAAGRRVAVHAGTVEGITSAIEAGADTIEHGFLLAEAPEKITTMMVNKDIFLVPTLYIHERWDTRQDKRYSRDILEKVRAVQSVHPKSFKAAVNAGVRIAMGSDEGGIPGSPIGEGAYELELMVRHGMSEMDAISAATANAANALGVGNDVGCILEEMLADVLVVEGDPTEDITVLSRKECIRKVIADGLLVKNES